MMRLIVLTGKHAHEQANAMHAEDAHLIVHRPPYYTDTDTLFRSRLRLLLVAATSGRRTCLVEPSSLRLPVPARRMLERVALGYRVPVYGSKAWLTAMADSSSSLPPPYPASALPVPVHLAWDRLDQSGIETLPPGVGRWPSGLIKTLLLVGDRPSAKWPASRPTWPFVSALRSGCSWWLAEQLERAGIPESMLYWIDAADRDGNPLVLRAEEHQHKFLSVIALGRHAAEWCWNNGWAFEHVHHPQYWHRFQNDKPYQLTKLLYKKGPKHEARFGKSSA